MIFATVFAAYFCITRHSTYYREITGLAHYRNMIENGHIKDTRYQIVMFVGDNLGDFDLSEKNLNPCLPEAADAISSLLGRKYILIPNVLSMPELRASANTDNLCSLPPEALAKLRISKLRRWQNAETP